jgi:S1-C subfamily serine protease
MIFRPSPKPEIVLWLFFLAVTFVAIEFSRAEGSDEFLRTYAVKVLQHPRQSWTGSGIYLGDGLVITAAHVVNPASVTKPTVLFDNLELPTTVVKEGDYEDIDLALLSVDENRLPFNLRVRRMSLCENQPSVGERVIVAVAESTANSHVISPDFLSEDLRNKFSTLIGDVASTGNSGSGVFDANRRCLLGIMSRKISGRLTSDPQGEPKDLAKYFVPASTIRSFIPAEYHF